MENKKSVSAITIAILLLGFGIILIFLRSLAFYDTLELHDRICTPLLGCKEIEMGFLFQTYYLFLLGILPTLAGVGLLMKKSWGWWLSLSFFSYGNFYIVFDLFTNITLNNESLGSFLSSVSFFTVILFSIFIILLTRNKLLDRYQIPFQNKAILYVLLLGIGIIMYLAYESVMFISSV